MVIRGLALTQTNATVGAGWRKLPGSLAVVVSLFFIFMLACAEGIQVSVIALATVPGHTYKDKSPLAYRTAQLALAGRNMSAFLVGRQFLTAMNMVLLSKVTSYAGTDGVLLDGGDWGMGTVFNEMLLQTGFLGAILVVNVAQLASQVTASVFPIPVINNYFMFYMLKLMLFIETIGVVNACWPLSYLITIFFGMQPDPISAIPMMHTATSKTERHVPSSALRNMSGGLDMQMITNPSYLRNKKSGGLDYQFIDPMKSARSTPGRVLYTPSISHPILLGNVTGSGSDRSMSGSVESSTTSALKEFLI